MSAIIERIIGGETDRRIVLSKNEIRRKLSFGSSWTKAAVGVRWCFRYTGTASEADPRFGVGLTAGTSLGYYDSAPGTHWVGTRIPSLQNLNYSAGPPARYTTSNTSQPILTRNVAGVFTNGAGWSTGAGTYSADPAAGSHAWILFFDKTTGPTTWTIRRVYPTSWTTHVSRDLFLSVVEANLGSLSQHATTGASSGATLGVDEATNGYLDSVSVFWNRSTTLVEVSDVVAARFS